MATYGLSTTKEVTWRGQRVQFSNVYHYTEESGAVWDDEAAINRVVALERPIFTNTVEFVEGRTWGPTEGGPATSLMRAIQSLSGNGGLAAAPNMYRECAILCVWPLGRYGSRNRPQFLRKWLHTQYAHGWNVDGSTAIGAVPTSISDYIVGVTDLTSAEFPDITPLTLSTNLGFTPVSVGAAFAYLEHRQYGR